jgi:membrane fusion protein (multidrug efflux system)
MDDLTPASAKTDAFTAAPEAKRRPRAQQRTRWFILLGGAVLLGLAIWLAYWLLVASRRVSTDNAYVGADVAQVTPLTAGPVAKVLVVETESVAAGQPLVILDDADARLAVAEAQADLGQAQRRVKGYFASDTALSGQVAAKQADIARADAEIASAASDLERARTDLVRRQNLAASGAVSGDELTTAQNRLSTAKAALAVAQASRAGAMANRGAAVGSQQVNTALISGASVEQNPEVAAARAKLDRAQLNLARTVIRAPIAGVVSKKAVQLGQQVETGDTLMAIVPTTRAFVDANFKEVQLTRVRPGQRVTLVSDLYGDHVKFHGRVRGLSGGTGSAFSLIPAQNASGNWIKVVQRLPVRIDLEPAELKEHPLRVGLSMKATVDLSDPSTAR